MIDTIILAGFKATNKLNTTESKALLKINGKHMIDYIIEALRKSEGLGRIIVVGPKKELTEHIGARVDVIVEDTGSIMDNFKAGLAHTQNTDNLLICTCDIPLITPEAINDFVSRSVALKVDLSYPIVEKKVSEKVYPEAVRTYVKIKEGSFTGGNVFFVNPQIVDRIYALSNNLLKVRKNPLKMAMLLGFRFLFKLIIGRMSIELAEKKLSGMFNIKARAIISNFPEIGNDVDKQIDLEVATHYLSKKMEE